MSHREKIEEKNELLKQRRSIQYEAQKNKWKMYNTEFKKKNIVRDNLMEARRTVMITKREINNLR